MLLAILEFLLTWWPVSAVLLVAISYWLARRGRSRWRYAAWLALALLAPIMLLIEGLVTGCMLQPGERCYWYGFGLTVAALIIVPASSLLLALGAFAARWPKRG